MNPAPKHVENSYWMVTVIPDDEFGVTKQELIASLRESDMVRPAVLSPTAFATCLPEDPLGPVRCH